VNDKPTFVLNFSSQITLVLVAMLKN
jgi:hypothetical protein